jgi:hypothetical protein
LNKLRGQSDPVPRPRDRAFDHGVYVKIAAKLRQGLPVALRLHGRRMGNDAQRSDCRKLRGQALREPVGEIVGIVRRR